jgi:hypothetical protein
MIGVFRKGEYLASMIFPFSPIRRRRRTLQTFHAIASLTISACRLLRSREAAMKQSDHFRENAENCQHLAERAPDHPTYLRYKRMEDAWRSLADEQDWLDGETPPVSVGH